MHKAAWLGVWIAVFGFGADIASADVISVAFTGHVDQVNDSSLGITVGQAVTGTYSYDASTPPSSGSGPNGSAGASYRFASPPANITVTVVGGSTYQALNTWTFQGSVANEGPTIFDFGAMSPSSAGSPSYISLDFYDIQSQWLTEPTLPTTAPPLSSTIGGGVSVNPAGSSGFGVEIDTATLLPSITVSPANSSFISQQNFDAVLLLSAQLAVASMQASVNGTNIGFSYPGTCQLAAANNAQRTALICSNAAAVLAGLGGGPITVNWLVTFADGSTAQQSVVWNLVL